MTIPAWLPEAFDYAAYRGDWERFLADVYAIFERDFKHSSPMFGVRAVTFAKRTVDGMEEGFWHITSSTDRQSGQRNTDLRRCERVPWTRPTIEHPGDPCISCWRNTRGTDRRVLLWLEAWDYLVVLTERTNVYVLVTAYCTDREHTRAKLRIERDRARKADAAP